MKIDSVDFFYLSMPVILDIGDGSQDALLVRIRAGNGEGWGECEASPLTSIASYVCPMSHSACKPVKDSVEGKQINDVEDIYRISRSVQEHSQDLLQANHTLSGIDIALWDLLGKRLSEPVYKLLGYKKAHPKLPYASQLFGESPEETFTKALKVKSEGFRAVKFGWGPFGKKGLKEDEDQVLAAREGLGKDIRLMIDAGTVWNDKLPDARERLSMLRKMNVFWLEEPFATGALNAYKALSQSSPSVALAGGEGCNHFFQAEAMMQHAGLKFIQIDAGRIGGITASKQVADLAKQMNITYVNHTFTSPLSLSASLQAFAGMEENDLCEYPVETKQLARDISDSRIVPDRDGHINVPEQPGLGISVDTRALSKYLVDVEIKVNGLRRYSTPAL
ncbi:MAG: mandelate racemase/muconate lactonizing enzyme family protein [Chitinophagales bacterium]